MVPSKGQFGATIEIELIVHSARDGLGSHINYLFQVPVVNY